MDHQSKSFQITKIFLVVLLVFLSLSGLFGISFLIDPSGELGQVPISLLDNLPIDNFILPGLYLLIVYGIGSAVIVYGLIRKLQWAPAAGLLLGLVLVGWVIGQIILWGKPAFLQYLYLVVGAGIFLLSWIIRKQGGQE